MNVLKIRMRAAGTTDDGRQALRLLGAGIGLLLLAGCGKAHPLQDRPDSHAAEDKSSYIPGEIHGRGWHIPWHARDPKNPHGPPIKVLTADAQTGSMAQQDTNIVLRLQHVHAKLYQEGKPAAIVDAGEITTDRDSKVVIGTGDVTVTSLTDPPDTVITADKMTWDQSTSKVIAIGNVHARQRKRNGQPSADTYSDRMEYDLATGRLKG